MNADEQSAHVNLRIKVSDEPLLGPGKAGLLERIDSLGSISAAARDMGMSYRRAWLLVDAMNRDFARPLVATAHGGTRGGGAWLTDSGREVLRLYRGMECKARRALDPELRRLRRRLSPR